MKLNTILVGLGCALALLAASSLGAEAAPKKKPQDDTQKQELPGIEKKFPTKGIFDLKSINGKPVPPDVFASLMVDEALRGSGNAGCNSWSATIYPSRGQRLAVGPIAVTRKVCDKPAMEIEHMFTGILHGSPFWDTNGSELQLKLPNAVMIFQRSL